jgi:transposase
VRFRLTGGEVADITQGEALLGEDELGAVIADKAFDSDAFVAKLEARGAEAVIPPRKNRTEPREYDKHLYKARNLVERFWNWVKRFRRVATRYEKTAPNFLGFVQVAAIMFLLR